MRSVMPQPCIGSSCSALSTSMSSVPWSRSPRSFVIYMFPFDCRKKDSRSSFRLSRGGQFVGRALGVGGPRPELKYPLGPADRRVDRICIDEVDLGVKAAVNAARA